jgi:ribosomal protein S18 acetylase RimI-like enzyme
VSVVIEVVDTADEHFIEAVQRLLPQLSKSARPPSAQDIETIVHRDATTMFVAKADDGSIVGMLTLAVFQAPTGIRGWIEDVVVDEVVRGQGAGEALVAAALEHARQAGARTVDLTSNPTREAANRLYVRCGMEQRITNVYRFSLEF